VAGTLWEKRLEIRSATQSFHRHLLECSSARHWIGAAIGLLFAAIALARPRWFCRYACPMGILLEGLPKLDCGKPPGGSISANRKICGPANISRAVAGYPLLLWMDRSQYSAASGAFELPARSLRESQAHTSDHHCFVELHLRSVVVRPHLSIGGTQDLLPRQDLFGMGGAGTMLRESRLHYSYRFSCAAGIYRRCCRDRDGFPCKKDWSGASEDAPLRPPGQSRRISLPGFVFVAVIAFVHVRLE